MGRIRTVKPEFWKSEDMSTIHPESRLLAIALLNHSDDEGYFNANEKLIKAECCPLTEDSLSVHERLNQLSKIGYLILGKTEEGKSYGKIINFNEYQRVNRPTPSKIRDLAITWQHSPTTHEPLTEDSLRTHSGKERKGKEKEKTNPESKALPSNKQDELKDFTEEQKRVLTEKLERFNINAESFEKKIPKVLKYYNSLTPKEQSKFYVGALNMRENGMPIPEEGSNEMKFLLILKYEKEFGKKSPQIKTARNVDTERRAI